jgi:hypothetical protein
MASKVNAIGDDMGNYREASKLVRCVLCEHLIEEEK